MRPDPDQLTSKGNQNEASKGPSEKLLTRRAGVAAAFASVLGARLTRAQAARVLRFVPFVDLFSLDPALTNVVSVRTHGYLVFDTLYGVGDGYVPRPQMLAGHRVEDDGLTWLLTLRDGLLFHDGQSVLARDCVASIRRWAVHDPLGQALMARTDSLSAMDDRTLRFRLKRLFPLLPYALGKLGGTMCAIMPERLASADPFRPLTEMVGSGPYRFRSDERVFGVRLVYERFERYLPRPDGLPERTAGPKVAHFDRVEWHVIPDPAAALGALVSGAVDVWEIPPADLLPLVRPRARFKLELVHDTGFCALLRPNHRLPPFDDGDVRRAVLGAIDQSRFMAAVAGIDGALWQVPCGFFPPGSPFASDAGMDRLPARPDADRAKRALADAGYRDKQVVLLGAADIPALKALDDVADEMLRGIGMPLDYQAMDGNTMVQRRALLRGWNAFCGAPAGVDLLDPGVHLPLRGTGAGAWPGWPTSPAIEALRDEWLDATDLASQRRIAASIQAQAFIDLPYYPLGTFYTPSAYRSDLTGILRGLPLFWNIRRP
jgi:peptide/nickel transport system substrate-binding protein